MPARLFLVPARPAGVIGHPVRSLAELTAFADAVGRIAALNVVRGNTARFLVIP